MPAPDQAAALEEQIAHWRGYLLRRQAIHSVDVAELEDHLREQVAVLVDAGLTTDEAFLVAVKRMGNLDDLSREFAREHSDRLWKQLVLVPSDAGEPRTRAGRTPLVAFGLAVAAAVAVKLPALFGVGPGRRRRLLRPQPEPLRAAAAGRLLRLETAARRPHHPLAGRWRSPSAAVFANVYPVRPGGSHRDAHGAAPAARAVAGGRRRLRGRPLATGRRPHGLHPLLRRAGSSTTSSSRSAAACSSPSPCCIFQAIGIDIEPFFESWLLPCGALAAVVVAAWLVEAKQSVIENMAPVLTRLFTPLLRRRAARVPGRRCCGPDAASTSSGTCSSPSTCCWSWCSACCSTPSPPATRRRPPTCSTCCRSCWWSARSWPTWWRCGPSATRITELGFTPNRVAALGENVILLVNLAWSAVLYIGFLRGRGCVHEAGAVADRTTCRCTPRGRRSS